MSMMSDGMPRVRERNGEMKDAQTQTDDELLAGLINKETIS